ncbi:GDP-mannose 4,6-dehydratase [bacterium]|jgi:GDPmannose 4,6-dehydratase|nr:GDP-mannose 4,6-dehydratase [bacterium]
MKKALITGVTGQDGFYLSELLLKKNYVVHGIKRRASLPNTSRIDSLYKKYNNEDNKKFFLHDGDLSDFSSLVRIIGDIKPDEIYNLGAQSFVKVSFDIPEYTAQVDGLGALRILEAIKILGLSKKTKFYQASTSELYGKVVETPQKETTPFYPRSPYGVAKLYAYWITVNYRESYGIFACNGILFNHESPLRGEEFVTRKITKAVAKISLGLQKKLVLGNLDSKRDWGFAGDYVEAMWLMLQQKDPEDFVISTGKTWTIRYFVEEAFKNVGINVEWKGSKENEMGLNKKTGAVVVSISKEFYRPAEVDLLLGDNTKAKNKLGWKPKTKLKDLVKLMVKSDLKTFNL